MLSELKWERSATSARLKKFSLALEASDLFLSRADQLIFLCGANQSPGVPSARRTALKRFAESFGYRVVYAEAVFNELARETRKNVLDLEHEISAIADKIVVVLESESAFCELGAFTHKELRKKLVVINDSAFRKSDSFINTGPLTALEEVGAPVLWYPMGKNGTTQTDGIGATFAAFKNAIAPNTIGGSIRVKQDLALLLPTKASLYFIHDLILFTGPVSQTELLTICKFVFGENRSYDRLRRLLGILVAAGIVSTTAADNKKDQIYRTPNTAPYMKYAANVYALSAAFRVHHLREAPERFECTA